MRKCRVVAVAAVLTMVGVGVVLATINREADAAPPPAFCGSAKTVTTRFRSRSVRAPL